MSVEDIFAVASSACPSLEEIKKLPNRTLLWCGKLFDPNSSPFASSLLDVASRCDGSLAHVTFSRALSGTRSSNLLRHLHKGFLPAVCSVPGPGYMVKLICHYSFHHCFSYMFL